MKLTVTDRDREIKTNKGLEGLWQRTQTLLYWPITSSLDQTMLCYLQDLTSLPFLLPSQEPLWVIAPWMPSGQFPWLTISLPIARPRLDTWKILHICYGPCIKDFPTLTYSGQWFMWSAYTQVCCFSLFTQAHPVQRNLWWLSHLMADEFM